MSPWTSLFAAGAKHREGGRLLLLLIVAVVAGTLLLRGEATAKSLWQSPQSPPPEPENQAEPPTPTPQPPPPTDTPAPTQPPPTVAQQEAATVEAAPTETAQLEPSPTPPPPTPTNTPAPTQPPPTVAPEPQAQGSAPEPQPAPVERQQTAREEIPFDEEEAGGRNLILDRIELIDTLAVSGAYIWLCCGVGLLLILPIFLLVLYIRGRSRIIQEETYF